MPVSIKNLIVNISIGNKEIILESDKINTDPDNIGQNLQDSLAQGFSFKMQKGTSVTVNVGDLVGWFKSSFSSTQIGDLENDVKGFINKANNNVDGPPSDPTALDGINLELSALSFSARKPSAGPAEITFGFTIKVSLDSDFYSSLGLNGVANIIRLNSVGFSLTYPN